MSAMVKTRCPVCAARYDVRTATVGRRARCAKCDSVFRVAACRPAGSNGTHHAAQVVHVASTVVRVTSTKDQSNQVKRRIPTEDDVLRWLDEAQDEEDRELAVRPRVISDANTRPATLYPLRDQIPPPVPAPSLSPPAP